MYAAKPTLNPFSPVHPYRAQTAGHQFLHMTSPIDAGAPSSRGHEVENFMKKGCIHFYDHHGVSIKAELLINPICLCHKLLHSRSKRRVTQASSQGHDHYASPTTTNQTPMGKPTHTRTHARTHARMHTHTHTHTHTHLQQLK